VQVVQALLGLDDVAARHLLARLLLDSAEARALVEATPPLIRVLRNQQGTVLRTEASIRGPVLWNATISHRAASGFQDDLYVCAMAVRDYDLAENRALAAALLVLRRAGRLLDGITADPPDDHQATLRARARRAANLGSHPRLRGVATRRPSPRELAKVRSGTARTAYEPAVAFLERTAQGPALADLECYVDRQHRAHHELLRLVVGEVERTGALVEPLRTWRGQLFSGRLRYLPPRQRGADAAAGVAVGEVVFALPEPGDPTERGAAEAAVVARHRGRRVVVVTDPDDVRRALGGSRTEPAPSRRAPDPHLVEAKGVGTR
jgi:hypothetical protein